LLRDQFGGVARHGRPPWTLEIGTFSDYTWGRVMTRRAMPMIYTDTNVLRYFGTAFASSSVPADIQVELLLAPLALMELLSQLGTPGAAEACAAIHALPHVHNPERTGLLPWSDDLFRIAVFNLPPGEDTITPALNNAVVNVLNAATPEELHEDGEAMRTLLDQAKDEAANNFSALLNDWRSEGPLDEAQHRAIFARSIARRAGVDETHVAVDSVVRSLEAHYVFESQRMQIAARSRDYNVGKHSNDVYDAELLIYLAAPDLHLLTSDKGFARFTGSSQFSRVHIVEAACLQNPETASRVLRNIT